MMDAPACFTSAEIAAQDDLCLVIYPDPHTAALIESAALRIHRNLGLTGKPVAPERLHLTLLYLGSFSEWPNDTMQHALLAAAAIKQNPFEIVLDQVGSLLTINGSTPVTLLSSQVSTDLSELRHALEAAVGAEGFPPPDRNFMPHIALVEEARQIPMHRVPQVCWPATEFTLVRSVKDPTGRVTEHRRLGTWPLHV